ncbi:CAAX amino terminal protease family [Halobacteroides halobius DSM 5150]|uniref:CAAX amino terminal protease family n=1 Tax=Halobacteroides halobius (strain ATCC 35273 / DSM 5150 / MD-1) TaxID=748449 RepID=L0KA49_HALHC|nr:type II CAAX endopeptidase family protein [Halobacteroides halobius]AGB41871.1 CAAX amino terminal protease family [Halobacteroides halobius DSM 5150]
MNLQNFKKIKLINSGIIYIFYIVMLLIFPIKEYVSSSLVSSVIYMFIFYGGILFLIISKLYKSDIQIKKVIGNLSKKNELVKIFSITITLVIFSVGSLLSSLYFFNILFPSIINKIIGFINEIPSNNITLDIIRSVFLVPIVEEVLFRYLLLGKMTIKLGIKKSIIISSIIFSILHINFIGSFVFAVVLSLVYLKTGKLILPILIHSFNNVIAIFLKWLEKFIPTTTSLIDIIKKGILPFKGFGLICFIFSTILIVIYIYKLWLQLDD